MEPPNHRPYSQPSDGLSLPEIPDYRGKSFEDRVEIHESRERISHHPLRLSSHRRASAVLFSILVFSATVFSMMVFFSTKFHIFESELPGKDNNLRQSSLSSHTLFHTSNDTSSRLQVHSRGLTSTKDSFIQHHRQKRYPGRIVDNLRQKFASVMPILFALKQRNRQNAFTTVFSPHIAYFSPLTAIPRTDGDRAGYTTVISVYHIRNGMSESPRRPFPLSSLSEQMRQQARRSSIAESSISSTPPRHAPNVLQPRQTPSKALNIDTPSSLRSEVPTSAFKPTGLEKGEESRPLVTDSQRSKELKVTKGVRHHLVRGAEGMGLLNGLALNIIQKEKTIPRSEDMIEIWLLRSGNFVCRIYNIGRLPEGRLVLPEWMEKHSKLLLHQCGVKDPVFSIKSRSNHSQFVFNKKRLNMTGRVRVVNNANLDLLEANTPRHHMPHFVSDILLPMRAMELLKGSGNGIANLSSLRRRSSPNSPEATIAAFPDLKPSMFLSEATWEASPSTWVRRLAKLFSHPNVNFTLLSEKVEEKPKRRFISNKNSLIWRFRSVLSSNLSPYEREGLFDTNGNNLVFSHNGLYGAPAMTITGISQEPCRVSVTALTRFGPRALLHLDILKNEAMELFERGRLFLDFKTVKFDNAGFDLQVKTMRETNVLIATHGAGNTNVIFMRPGATVIEIFPFAYRAGPFDSLARTFGLEYKAAMSAPQTKVFKECMNFHESNNTTRKRIFEQWDKAVAAEKIEPGVHRLELEKEFGEPGKSEGMATRQCVRRQQLAFHTKTVAAMAFESAMRQCNDFRLRSRAARLG